jgi:nitroreductase
MDPVLERRSIRKYTEKKVEESKVKTLLEAGMSAPSAHNEQPWHFVVIDNREILDKIPEFHPYSQMLRGAPLAILVCCDTSGLDNEDFWVQDCSAATENILVEARNIGLGSVWMGIYPKKELMKGIKELTYLPDGIIPFSLISIGYPAYEKEPSGRFSEDRVHRNKW